MIINIVGLELDDLLVLFRRQLEDIVGTMPRLDVAKGPQINASQQFVCRQIRRIALDDVLGLDHSVTNAAGLGIEFGKTGSEVLGSGIGINGSAIFLDRFAGQVAASVNRYLLLVGVGESVVIVSRRPVDFVGRGLSGGFGV